MTAESIPRLMPIFHAAQAIGEGSEQVAFFRGLVALEARAVSAKGAHDLEGLSVGAARAFDHLALAQSSQRALFEG